MPSKDYDGQLNTALLKKDLEYIKEQVGQLREDIHTGYITRSEFEPVQKLVYGLVGLILVSVVGAIIALVLR